MKKIILIVAVLVVAIIGYRFTSEKNKEFQVSEKKSTVRVSASSVEELSFFSDKNTYSGTVDNMQNTKVKAGSNGTLTSLRVRVGSKVSAGQLLATIENPESGVDTSDATVKSSEINQAEIRLEQAKKMYREAQKNYDANKSRTTELSKKLAKLDYESAQIALQTLLDGHYVKSPVSGIVTSLPVSKNDTVSFGQEIATIGLPNNSKISFFVSKNDVQSLFVGKEVSIIESENTAEIKGIISQISPEADVSTGKFLIEVKPENSKINNLVSGTIVKIMTSLEEKSSEQVFFVPLEAMLVGQNENTVFMLDESEKKAIKKVVTVLDIRGGFAKLSMQGWDRNNKIITSNIHALEDGDEIVVENKK